MKKPKSKYDGKIKRVRPGKKGRAKKPRKPGRPKKELTKPKRDLLKRLAKHGAIDEQLAAAANVSPKTYYRLLEMDPEFRKEIEDEKGAADKRVIGSLYAAAVGMTYEEITQEPALVVRNQQDGKTVTTVLKQELVVTKVVRKFIPPSGADALRWLSNRPGTKKDWKVRQTVEDPNGKPIARAYVIPGFEGGHENAATAVAATPVRR